MAALDVIQRRRAERPRGSCVNLAAAGDMDVAGVVGPRRRRDGGLIEQPFLNGQQIVGARRRQHDIDDALPDHLADLLSILGERLEPQFAVMPLRRQPRRAHAERHVGVLGISEDEVLAPGRIGMNGGEFTVEGFLHVGYRITVQNAELECDIQSKKVRDLFLVQQTIRNLQCYINELVLRE